MLPETTATDEDRAIISGHYVFATPEGVAIRAEAATALAARGIDLDARLKTAVKASISRYLEDFRLTRHS